MIKEGEQNVSLQRWETGDMVCFFPLYRLDGTAQTEKKRGFRTKKEAVKFEMEFIASVSGDMDMTFASFIEVYFQDKSGELKQNSGQK